MRDFAQKVTCNNKRIIDDDMGITGKFEKEDDKIVIFYVLDENLVDFSLVKCQSFAKFSQLSSHQTFLLYEIIKPLDN